MTLNKKRVLIAVIAIVVVVAAVVVVVVLRNLPANPTATPTSSTKPSTTDQSGAALIVKIDNVADARPQTGLSAADVIYVEPVEGGLTRLAAVYMASKPAVVGPVRSARESDIELLAQYGKPTLAYSGAAPELLPALHAASLINASPQEFGAAFFRDSSRVEPHNLYVHPDQLPAGQPPVQAVLNFGAAPSGGTATTDYQVDYQAAKYAFHWDASGHWSVNLDGTPVVSTEASAVAPSTIIVQTVQTVPGQHIEDVAGSPSPVAKTVGTGPVVVLRDGHSYSGTWSRTTAQEPTMFTTPDGHSIPLAKGQVWILLKPA